MHGLLAMPLAASTGQKLHLFLANAEHQTFTDVEELRPVAALPDISFEP